MPGKADESIIAYRMGSTHRAVMMPEIGRSTRHDEGVPADGVPLFSTLAD